MNMTCATHRHPDQDCPACGLAELAKMARPGRDQPTGPAGWTAAEDLNRQRVACRACTEPADPANPYGLCGVDNAMHADVERKVREMAGAV